VGDEPVYLFLALFPGQFSFEDVCGFECEFPEQGFGEVVGDCSICGVFAVGLRKGDFVGDFADFGLGLPVFCIRRVSIG
jgi:hypothetical protein